MKLINSMKLLYLLLGFGIFGCTNYKSQTAKPALLKSSSIQTRITLETAIASLLNSKTVKLADTAFTLSSTLMIEQSHQIGNSERVVEDRSSRSIDSFILLIQTNTCILKHQQSQKELILSSIECVAAKSD